MFQLWFPENFAKVEKLENFNCLVLWWRLDAGTAFQTKFGLAIYILSVAIFDQAWTDLCKVKAADFR